MRRMKAGLYHIYYSDMGGKDINEGDAVSDGKLIHHVVKSDDGKFLGITSMKDNSIQWFTEEMLQNLRKVVLSREESEAWKNLEFVSIRKEELANRLAI